MNEVGFCLHKEMLRCVRLTLKSVAGALFVGRGGVVCRRRPLQWCALLCVVLLWFVVRAVLCCAVQCCAVFWRSHVVLLCSFVLRCCVVLCCCHKYMDRCELATQLTSELRHLGTSLHLK